MSRLERNKESKLEKLDIPKDIVLSFPKIEIIGRNEIRVENHKGIIIFDKQEIKLKTKVGVLKILGDNFNLLFMGGETLIIEGDLKSLEYEGEK